MANNIKGITIEIGGDTTKLQNALKGVNGDLKSTKNELKEVDIRPQEYRTFSTETTVAYKGSRRNQR